MQKFFSITGLGIAITLSSGWRSFLSTPITEEFATTQPRMVYSITPFPKRKSFPKSTTSQDMARFQALMAYAQQHDWEDLSMGELMGAIATQLIGTEYKAGLLDQFPQETLFTSLTQFDCVLFVETVFALARNIARQDYSHTTFTQHIEDQRYRNGQLDGYCSRLHYFTAWIQSNEARGNVIPLQTETSGTSLDQPLNYMTTHRQKYPQLRENQENYTCLKSVETELADYTLHYIPQAEIHQAYPYFQPGDIVGVATQIEGLDFTHTGLIYPTRNGNTGLIHASPAGQVTITRDLQTYIGQVDNAIGVVVVRPLDPRLNAD